MKKILLLGGSAQQVIAIETAKRMGLYTILCDYLPNNPGQHYADKFYLASTTDKETILKIAEEEQIDGIVAYASDPAAPTAAYVAEKLNLPGNPYESVNILCNKDRFRAFLAEHHFCTPFAKSYKDDTEATADLKANVFHFPVIVKPVDSSGSKGVSRIDSSTNVEDKILNAFEYSRSKTIIIEEWVEKYGYQIAGDGLSIDGKLVFRYFANDHFDSSNSVNPFVPISASFPYNMPNEIQEKIHNEIQRLITLLGMKTCTYNYDMRIDKDYNIYLMEVAPRDGGNYIPDIIKHATGVDLIECSIKAAIGETITLPENHDPRGYYSYYAVHSDRSGVLDRIEIAPWAAKKIVDNHVKKKPGDYVMAFTGANAAMGCYVMRFDCMDEMLDMMEHSEKWIKIILRADENGKKSVV